MQTKVCSQCKRAINTDDFYKNKSKADGLQNVCKVCTKKNGLAKKGIALTEERKKQLKHYYHTKIKDNNYFLKERERKKNQRKNRSQEQKDAENLNRRIRYKTDFDFKLKCNINTQLHRNMRGTFTEKQLISRFELYGWKCAYCGETENLTIDHIISKSKGGLNFASNIVPACKKCNVTKQNEFWKPNLPKSNIRGG